MKDFSEGERLVDFRAVLAHWDIPPLTAVAAVLEDRPVFKISTIGPMFILKDSSDAPDLTRLEFTRNVLTHVALGITSQSFVALFSLSALGLLIGAVAWTRRDDRHPLPRELQQPHDAA